MLKVNNKDTRTGHVIAGWVDGSSVFTKITHDKEILIK